MGLKVEAKEKEPARKLIRRFSQRLRQSGILRRAKAIRFRKRPLSKTRKKLAALRREEIKKKIEEAKK